MAKRGRPVSVQKVPEGDVKELDKAFEKHGYKYSLLKRNKKAAMYKKVGIDFKDTGYEVFSVKIGKPFSLKDKRTGRVYDYPAMEKFPRDEDFGTIAWDYETIESATKKFKTLK